MSLEGSSYIPDPDGKLQKMQKIELRIFGFLVTRRFRVSKLSVLLLVFQIVTVIVHSSRLYTAVIY